MAPAVSAALASAQSAGGTHTYTQEVPFDFSGFDFNDFSEGAGAAGRRARRWRGFRDIFSNIFGGGGGRGEAMQRPSAAPTRIPGERRLLAGHPRRRLQLNIPRLEVCANCHGEGYIESPGDVPMSRQWPDHAEERQHEVQRHLPALRRDGQESHRLPGVPRRRPRAAYASR